VNLAPSFSELKKKVPQEKNSPAEGC